MDLLDRIDDWAVRVPDRIAHRSGGRTLSYAELRAQSNALAARLWSTLPDDGAPVAVIGHKEPEMIVAFLGCAKAGHPYVPIDTAMPPMRAARIVELAAASLSLTAETIADWSAGPGERPPRQRGPGDAHYIMFTSGTSGDPKGVVITAECLDTFLAWMEGEHGFRAGETFLNQTTFSFDLSVMEVWVALATGGTIVSLTRAELDDARRLFDTLSGSGATTWISTPSFAQLCLVERTFGQAMMPRLERMLFCGEVLPPAVASALLERFPEVEVWNTYGPTEATVACSSIRIDRALIDRYAALPIGYPMRPGGMMVVDREGHPAPEGESGELVIVGPNVSAGYYRRPDLTSRAFFTWDGQRAYRTGDGGHVRDGLFFCDGRLDRQIKLHGYRIELGDVEAHLCALSGVREAVVIPEVRDGTPVALLAFIVPDGPPPAQAFQAAAALRSRLAERLPQHMLPRRIRFMSAFPMTPNGKIDRRRVAELV